MPTLEAGGAAAADVDLAANYSAVDAPPPRSYPSSRQREVDWDALEKEAEEEAEADKPQGDAALQKLFRQIYANADEDTRRAMNKSFQESNGTVLSTNWTEVGTGKVECKPPDGMETRKYEQ